MCGISGFNSIPFNNRLLLTIGLSSGIDDRGGDAAGFVSVSKEGFRYARRRGEWRNANARFVKAAAMGDLCMMHARYATCGNDSVQDAHPFAIKRNGKVKLWGAHNGMIYDAWESANQNNRFISVDSQEVFELLADNDISGIQNLSGYGVISWINSANPHSVNIARLSENSDLCVASLEEGGIVWASTWKILSKALDIAELHAKSVYELEIGNVYEITGGHIYSTGMNGLQVNSYYKPARSWGRINRVNFMTEYEKELEWLCNRWSDNEDIQVGA